MDLRDDQAREDVVLRAGTPASGENSFLGTIGPDGFYGSGWEETLFGEHRERWRRRAGGRRHRRKGRR
jgi:hypothetical protein